MRRILGPAVLSGLLAAACGDDGGTGAAGGAGGSGGSTTTATTTTTTTTATTTSTSTMEVCGDGEIGANEGCDDNNTADGDGCDSSCAVEPGYMCIGEPSVCAAGCGDGIATPSEACDDGNLENLDGCSAMCAVEAGWDCTGTMPSVCSTTCGDGVIGAGGEDCDDGNTSSSDGCADDCTIEPGFSCMGEPSQCSTSCGDGVVAGTESCDDANAVDADGCTSCATDLGYSCTGSPSVCSLAGTCADPIVVVDGSVFQWADMNDFGDDLANADSSCLQPSLSPGSKPDVVFQVDLAAGDTLHVAESGGADVLFHVLDGACASASPCLESFDGFGNSEIVPGLVYQAAAAGSYYVVIDSWISDPDPLAGEADLDLLFEISPCGDGLVGAGEACDDGGTAAGDGCSATCSVETGYQCAGEPSTCGPLPGQSCADAIVATDGFTYVGSNIAAYGDNLDFPSPSCSDVEGATYDSPEIVFSVDLTAGDTLIVREFGTLDVVMHILPAACASGSVCAASTDFSEAGGVGLTAPTTGTYYAVVESWSNAPSASSTFDIRFQVISCGDGAVEGGEGCDDGNNVSGDGCSATCAVEPGFLCTGSPSTCSVAPGTSCSNPLVITTFPFQMTGSQLVGYGADEDYNASPSCAAVPPGGGADIMFQVTLAAGETVRLRELSPFDGVYHILSTCAGGSTCLASSDISEATGLTYTATAAGTYFLVVENAAPLFGNTPFDIVIDKFACGDGVVSGPEACDDGNTNAGDGCSASCALEPGFACDTFAPAPSTCFSTAGCTTAACYLGPCSGTVVTASPANLPMPILDEPNPPLNVPIPVAAAGTVQKMVVFFNATHTWDADLVITLAKPGGPFPGIDLCSNNGFDGDNFANTFLRDGVPTPITAGTAPFSGVYRPETPLATFTGQPVNGVWVMRFDDNGPGDVGVAMAAELAFCVTP